MEALAAAKYGSLCLWNNKPPRDFADLKVALQDPDTRVQLIACTRRPTEAEAFGVVPITIPPLNGRAKELPRIVEEYAHDATTALGLPRGSFLGSDRDWVVRNAAESIPEIEKATLRLLAIRVSGGNMSVAAAHLGMARWSLAKWADRRRLPVRMTAGD